ncbi:MAG TPA: hypothetical protein VEZ90_16980, partial [Blastocatellia bacterium]|nr:hypothetical protein [Blastocatellia bacterium]
MPLSDAESQLVRSLASEGRWPELVTRLQSERSGETVLHLAGVLREIGADCLTAGKWAEAAVCYRLAQWPVNYGAELAFRPEQLQEFYLSFYELIVKSDEAVANGTAQGADFWDSLTAVVTSLAAAGHFAEAEYILMRLQNGPDREWAERLEDVAAKLPLPDQAERADWLLRQAKYGYSLYASLDSATSEYWERQSERVREKVLEIEGLAAAQDENEEIVEEDQAGEGRQEVEDGNAPTLPADAFARLAELTRNREFDERADLLDDEYSPFREQIAGHFQAEGDRFRERGQLAAALDAYSVAIQASEDKSRLSAVVQNLRKADLDNKMENAIPDESIVVVTGWENGLDRVV